MRRILSLSFALLLTAAACESNSTGSGSSEQNSQNPNNEVEAKLAITVNPTEELILGGTISLSATVTLDDVANGEAIVIATLTQGESDGIEVPLLASTDGNYFGDFRPEQTGQWTITAVATIDDLTATGTGTLEVVAPSCSDGVRNGTELGRDCGGDCEECKGPPGPLIGTGDGSAASVTFTPIITDNMQDPTDIAFDPNDRTKMWVTDRANDALIYVENPGTPQQTEQLLLDWSKHFLEEVVAIDIGGNGNFGTCGDSRNSYDDNRAPNNFMGPVLWAADVDLFDEYGPNASNAHLDMLHNSPQCMGIAWDRDNAYYVFNGFDGSLDWYDFQEPHPPGTDDHSDGLKKRYLGIELTRVAGTPSHMQMGEDGWLYIADTGAGRILRVDVASGEVLGQFFTYINEQPMVQISDAIAEDFVSADKGILFNPSGLVWFDETLYVSDAANGQIVAFDSTGERINTLVTGLGGAIGGIDIGPDDKLYVIDRKGKRVLRIDP